MRQTAHELPTSEHFEAHEIAGGVYAAIAIPGGAARSNASIIDLGDRTLIVDTFVTPKAAQDLRVAAEQLTGRPASYVIITHAHSDHWMGNQVFADHATIISTHGTREQMLASAEELRKLQADPSELQQTLRADEERLAEETDEQARDLLQTSIDRARRQLEMLPTLELRFPVQTFDGKLVFHGSRRTAELITKGEGHTPSDSYLVLPAQKVAFVGDLAFFACQPYMGQCIPHAWVTQIDDLCQSDVEVFVPGHGPLGTKADLELEKRYILTQEKLVGQVVEKGGTVEDALAIALPEPFNAWEAEDRRRFEMNVRTSYERLSGN